MLKIPIGINLVLQFHHDELHHDRVVEKTEHRNLVGNDVIRFGKVRHSADDSIAVSPSHPPLRVFEHIDEHFEFFHSIAHEIRSGRLTDALNERTTGSDDLLFARFCVLRTNFFHHLSEILEVVLSELESNLHRIGHIFLAP
jgi:hypothetical protein